ncbi:MAG: lytic transglycosylase domain-containing protein, partial [Pseudomonadota bacterium]
MSSMATNLISENLLARPMVLAAVAAACVTALATPSSAQLSGGSGGNTMVAQQPRPIGSEISMWEYLQETRELSFAEYANFAMAHPDFPRMEIIRLRAEAALENEAPSSAALIQYFSALPPLTNPARARYALSLSSAQRPDAFDVAREAWRGGQMSGPAEAYLIGLFGSRFSADDHAARMDALLWQGEREAASRLMMSIDGEARQIAMARLSLLNGTMPRDAGLSIPNAANRDAGFTFNLVNHLRSKRRTGEAISLLANRPLFNAPALDAEELVGDMLAVAEAASAADTVRIA